MNKKNINRILVYTHNSIGLGHAFRTLAVITGIRKWRPDIDFLVVSGTSIPHIFFRQGIEVVKLPSIKLDLDHKQHPLCPRYLATFNLEEMFDFRQRILSASFDSFEPDALVVEHNMTGQMNELIPLHLKKWMRRGGAMDFALIYICRGIMSRGPLLRIPYQNPRHRSESVNIGELYDIMYVLEERDFIDVNKEFLGNDPKLDKKVRYLGRITHKLRHELLPLEEVWRRFNLADKKTILMTLGRYGRVIDIFKHMLAAFKRLGLDGDHQVVITLDPYLDLDKTRAITAHALGNEAIVLPFVPSLVDLINVADLVVCRAGYNTINEILLTDTKALIIPEHHAGGEQELRAATIPQDNVTVVSEADILRRNPDRVLREILDRPVTPLAFDFDKYKIGKAIIDYLEKWKARRPLAG